MRKTLLIIQREYITRVRKRSFIALTILGPLFFGLIMVLPILFADMGRESINVLVVDESGFFEALPDQDELYFVIDRSGKEIEQIKDQFQIGSLGEDAILYIPAISADDPRGIMLYSREQMGMAAKAYLEKVVADKLEKVNLKTLDLTEDDLVRIRPKVFIQDRLIDDDRQESGAGTLAATGLAYIMGFLTYIALLIYGSMVMRGVMEEKTNRIVEVMISTVKPIQLMIGKIIGIGAVGLTQFMIWGILLSLIQLSLPVFLGDQLAAMQQTGSAEMSAGEMNELIETVNGLREMRVGFILVVFIAYFLGGYFIYASLFAAVGSLVSDEETEVQMYSFPLTMLILASIFIATAVIQQPNTKLAFWASIIPFSSPVVMPALIPFGVPAWHLILSLVMLVAGFLGTSWIGARIYRTGILMYGKKIRVKEVWRWIRYR
jgi:ABC-2 type transport system permease protein